MKKHLLLFLILILSLTSCNNKTEQKNTQEEILTCSKTETDEDGYNITDTMVVTAKNGKVVKATETTISEINKNMVDIVLSFGEEFTKEFNEIEGIEATYSKESDSSIKYIITVDYTKLDIKKLKDNLKNVFNEKSFYSSKDKTIEEFKKENLSDYTCK